MAPLRIALLGSKFMGKAHSNAWTQAPHFFDLDVVPSLKVIAARDATYLEAFARRWRWDRWTTEWRDAVVDPEVDLVDVATPNYLHGEQTIAALEAGKHVACEKPPAGTLQDAGAMLTAAGKSQGRTFVWYNYRRVPAVALAHRLVAEGRLGHIYHVRAAYLQSWGAADTPMRWRFSVDEAGSGAHGALNAHIVDMARFITGDEIIEVTGAIEERFIDQRAVPDRPGRQERSTVDDAVLFLARFERGAVASFEATRLATGFKNANRIEIHGELGALRFNFERMNELEFFDAADPVRVQGWRTIIVTGAEHPYATNWWPDGHGLGYEHTFVNQAADIALTLAGKEPVVPLVDFADAYMTQRVLEAALQSARHRTAVKLSEVP